MEYEAVQKLKEKLLEIGKEKQIRKPNSVLEIIAKTKPHNTREEIAEEQTFCQLLAKSYRITPEKKLPKNRPFSDYR